MFCSRASGTRDVVLAMLRPRFSDRLHLDQPLLVITIQALLLGESSRRECRKEETLLLAVPRRRGWPQLEERAGKDARPPTTETLCRESGTHVAASATAVPFCLEKLLPALKLLPNTTQESRPGRRLQAHADLLSDRLRFLSFFFLFASQFGLVLKVFLFFRRPRDVKRPPKKQRLLVLLSCAERNRRQRAKQSASVHTSAIAEFRTKL